MLGLKKNLNLLVDYDPLWESAFIDERKRIAVALANVAKGIEHYDSTAVPGMRAKPILDILVGVSPFDDWAGTSRHFAATHHFGRFRSRADIEPDL
jgi:GrpB-like predicted nucleotidyltransferase (UPF0157 family)